MQLKKLWGNLKQQQKWDAAIKERQSRLATSEIHKSEAVNIDSNISGTVSNMILTAPVVFSSDLHEDVMEGKQNNFCYF